MALSRGVVSRRSLPRVSIRERARRAKERGTACPPRPLDRVLAASRQRVRGGRHCIALAVSQRFQPPLWVRLGRGSPSWGRGGARPPASGPVRWLPVSDGPCCSAQPRPRPPRGLGGELQATTGNPTVLLVAGAGESPANAPSSGTARNEESRAAHRLCPAPPGMGRAWQASGMCPDARSCTAVATPYGDPPCAQRSIPA